MSGGDAMEESALPLPRQFSFAGIASGLKKSGKRDLTIVAAAEPMVAAGVYTQNRICAAPVVLDREITPTHDARAVIINSGNANACTGEQGMRDAKEMRTLTADAIGCQPQQVLVMSTGVIGVPLEMSHLRAGIPQAVAQLWEDCPAFVQAAEGMLTTDTCIKTAARRLTVDGQGNHVLAGMAKGSGMIAPNMATMLGLVMTDVRLTTDLAHALLQRVTERTFNCITVDGHTSTNDTVLLMAPPASEPPTRQAVEQVEAALHEVCKELAQAIVNDGEGGTHRIDIRVEGCADLTAARQIAQAVANSPLVKTAVAGADPNWGRIVSAAGYAGPAFDPQQLRLEVNGHLLFQQGGPVPFDDPEVSRSMRETHVTTIHLTFGEGTASCRMQSTDLTAEYVRINADYRT